MGEGAASVERAIKRLRVLVIMVATVLLPFVPDGLATSRTLAYGILIGGWSYAVALLVFEPYRRLPVLMSAWVSTPFDIVVTLLWIGATGGVDSPWMIAVFVPIVLASFRYRPRSTIGVALLVSVAYVSMAAALGQLAGREVTVAVHVFYILVVATACGVIARERLTQLASRLRMLDLSQEVAQVGSWEWTITDGSLFWSAELRRIYGVPEDAVTTLESFYAAVHPDDIERVKRIIGTALEERSPIRFEHRIVMPSGETRWLHCRGRILVGENGAPRQLVGSTQDITDAKEMQEQLLVGRKLASLGTLASGIAHELNNPLAYVATSLALARRKLELAPLDDARCESISAALDAAQDGTRRVADIVRGLRVFSRSDDEPMRSVDLAGVAESALAIAAHEIGQRARLTREYGKVPAVVGSESRLLQVVLNLVVNAAQSIEPTQRGSKEQHEIRVRIDAASDGRVRLEVSDTGCGIATEHLPKVFDPFFTTKPPGVGTGLGLSICHGIVSDLGGEITVESSVGRGSTFRVMLQAFASASPAEVTPHEAVDTAGTVGRLRLLVVDDEPRYASSLRLLLGSDHDVEIASDGRGALALLEAGASFDVVLCDLMMPGMDGIELHEALTRSHPDLVPRIVFLTGGATTPRALAFLQRPEVRYLEKPVELATLERTILSVSQPVRRAAS